MGDSGEGKMYNDVLQAGYMFAHSAWVLGVYMKYSSSYPVSLSPEVGEEDVSVMATADLVAM